MSAALFQLVDQTLGYENNTVLERVSLAVHRGDKIALVGPSGCGKSTLLKRLYRQHPQQTALLPQQPGLVPALSLFHNIYIGRLQQHRAWYNLLNLIRPQAGPRQQIEALATQLNLTPQLWHSVDRLSGGQQQRTALGRALYRGCPIFIGDEPVASVDPVQADQLLQLIIERHDTCIVALHEPELALRHFNRIIGLRQGKIQLDAASDSLTLADLDQIYR